jgi:hypothetical protein
MALDQVDFNVEDFSAREAGDRSVYCKFYLRPVQDEAASAEAGRPIYNEQEFVEIRAAGNSTNVVDRKATTQDKQRFRGAYKLFKEGNEEQMTGTPLTEIPWITKSQIEEISYFRIRTLEALATVGDDVCTRIPGLYELKRKAVIVMERADKAAPIMALKAENDALKNELETLKNQVAELVAAKAAENAAKVNRA